MPPAIAVLSSAADPADAVPAPIPVAAHAITTTVQIAFLCFLTHFFARLQNPAPPYSVSAGIMSANLAGMTPDEIEYDGMGFRSWWKRSKNKVKKVAFAVAICVVAVAIPASSIVIGASLMAGATTATTFGIGAALVSISPFVAENALPAGADVAIGAMNN